MATAFSIAKRSTTAQITDKEKSAGFGVVGGVVYIDVGNGPVTLFDYLNNSANTVNIGAPSGATVTAAETGNGTNHQTTLTLTNTPLTLLESDGANGLGVKIYDFPLGVITIQSASASVRETTTSAILTTLNGGKNLSVGVGTVTQSNAVLATTEQDIIEAFTAVSSTVIDEAAAVASKVRAVVPAVFDGSGSAIDAFFNVGVPTDNDIDDPATTLWSGTISISWRFN